MPSTTARIYQEWKAWWPLSRGRRPSFATHIRNKLCWVQQLDCCGKGNGTDMCFKLLLIEMNYCGTEDVIHCGRICGSWPHSFSWCRPEVLPMGGRYTLYEWGTLQDRCEDGAAWWGLDMDTGCASTLRDAACCVIAYCINGLHERCVLKLSV